jgi:mono/diheme cytochrome c family protein
LISGKPFWSVPANVPIMFELMVLFSAFAALGGMLVLNNLPLPSHPLDFKKRFSRSTDDKFFLLIQASDPKFDEAGTRELLQGTSPAVLDDVNEDTTTPDELPKVIIYGMIILTVAALVPFALFAASRETLNREPRIHAIWDMDFQPKYKAQRPNPLFSDSKSMRHPPDGTIAVGDLREDDHLYRGKQNGAWARTFPKDIAPNEETVERGRDRFEIYCAPCHGYSGNGEGMVHKRASELQAAGVAGSWVPPTNLQQFTLMQQPVGQLFDSISNGVRSMPGYARQIDPEDRWAIIMYLRALEKMHVASIQDLTAAEREALKNE